MKGRRGIVLGVASLAVTGLLAATVVYWEDLRLEWWRRQAARDAVEEGFDPQKPTRAWKEIVDAGEKGFPHLASLLKDRRYEVWKAAVEVMDLTGRNLPPEKFLGYLRERDTCALVLYLITPAPIKVSEEAGITAVEWRWSGDSFERSYWTGGARPLTPNLEALRFLSEVLSVEGGPEDARDLDTLFKVRALHALDAMAESAEVDRLLSRTAMDDPYPEVRLQAAHAMGRRRGVIDWIRTPTLDDWERFSVTGDSGGFGANVFVDLGSIRCLVRVDHPRVLPVLLRLHLQEQTRPILEEAFRGRDALPLSIPTWLPFLEAARRFIGAAQEERRAIIRAGLELSPEDGRGLLRECLSTEKHPELILLCQAGLLFHGDEGRRAKVRRAFDERFQAWSNGGPGGEDLWEPAGLIIRSGDREVLEMVFRDSPRMDHEEEECIDRILPPSLVLEGAPERFHWLPLWWSRNKDRLRFDAALRKWVTR